MTKTTTTMKAEVIRVPQIPKEEVAAAIPKEDSQRCHPKRDAELLEKVARPVTAIPVKSFSAPL
jgi:hypothetical protein